MVYNLLIGGLTFCVDLPYPVQLEESVVPFLVQDSSAHADICIKYLLDFSEAPALPDASIGQDLLLRYYESDNGLICESMGGPRGPVAISVPNSDLSKWICYFNSQCYQPFDSFGNFLRLIPLPMIFQHFDILFLHGSYVQAKGRGILFTAPSGTGKTTQARLWKKYRDAEIICNDRTLVNRGMGSGYPNDGSDPVYSTNRVPLCAIVVLEQAPVNSVIRLKGSIALSKLIKQLVFPNWCAASHQKAYDQLLELYSKYPVYLLRCTPDEDAVICLENRLREDGVIS